MASGSSSPPPEGEFEVESLLSHRETDDGREFRIRWRGFTPLDDTWEPESNVHCEQIALTYYKGIRENFDAYFADLVEKEYPKNFNLSPKRLNAYIQKKGPAIKAALVQFSWSYKIAREDPDIIEGDVALEMFKKMKPSDVIGFYAIFECDGGEDIVVYNQKYKSLFILPRAVVMKTGEYDQFYVEFDKHHQQYVGMVNTLTETIDKLEPKARSDRRVMDDLFLNCCFRLILRKFVSRPLSTRRMWIDIRKQYELRKAHFMNINWVQTKEEIDHFLAHGVFNGWPMRPSRSKRSGSRNSQSPARSSKSVAVTD